MNESAQKEKNSMITAFVQHLKKMSDHKDEWPVMRDFLHESIRNHKAAAPIVEFITVLRHYKPAIYQKLKESSLPQSKFYPIIQIEIPLKIALNRLKLSIDL
jgi:hypothetical protein